MKTLDQVEPRIPISLGTTPGDGTAVFKITNPGSCYLTGNACSQGNKSGIVIAANNITIDLCRYALIGTVPNSLDGIRPSGECTRITIRNGHITGWGGQAITSYVESFPSEWRFSSCVFQDLVPNDIGGGISAGSNSSIFRCASSRSNGIGIGMVNDSGVSKTACRIRTKATALAAGRVPR